MKKKKKISRGCPEKNWTEYVTIKIIQELYIENKVNAAQNLELCASA